MARAALRWTIEDLAKTSDVGSRTIKRIEAADEIRSANISTLSKIQLAFEAASIEFIGTPDDGPGIRIRTASSKP